MKVDTFSLSTSTAYIKDFDRSKYTHSNISKPNGNNINNYSLVTDTFGIEKVKINETYDSVSLQLTSKILEENYYKGFCSETIEQALAELSKAGLTLDTEFLYNSKIKRLDIANDVKLTKPVSNYLNSLNHIVAPKFIKTLYDTGIVFKEKIATKSLYVTFYSKEYHSKKCKSFFKTHPEQLNHFKNILRMETKLSSTGTINKYLKGLNLPEVFAQPTINPLILDKIIGKQLEFPLMINTEKYSSTDEKNLIYTKYLHSLYNGDRKKMVEHISNKLGKKTKPTYQIQQLDKFLFTLSNSQDSTIEDNIQEIKVKLRAS